MNKILLKILFLGCISNLLLDISDAAEVVDQLIFVYVGTPKEYPLLSMSSKIKRINKTHQTFTPYLKLNDYLTDNHRGEIYISREDGGGWHPLVQRKDFHQLCSSLFTKSGLIYIAKRTFMPELLDECPFKPGTYNNSPIIIPRYRKDWPVELQAMIPPMVPFADKWRVDFKIFDQTNEFVGMYRTEVRLINQFSSQ